MGAGHGFHGLEVIQQLDGDARLLLIVYCAVPFWADGTILAADGVAVCRVMTGTASPESAPG